VEPKLFRCNICGSSSSGSSLRRGDGNEVLFCGDCGMGVIGNPPETTELFYGNGYYGGESHTGLGYSDYSLTAEHTLLWVRLLVGTVLPEGGLILDVGCADGFLLSHLPGACLKFGIEVNEDAARRAASKGIQIIGRDVLALEMPAYGGRFDFITSIATFEHVLDFKLAIETCLAALKPEGVMLFEVPLISKTEDNSGWFNGSYEHIYYPTIEGMQRLFETMPDVHARGFETKIKGFSSSFVGLLSRDRTSFDRVSRFLDAMTQETLANLPTQEQAINVAYNLVHRFDPTPERILAFPQLLHLAGATAALIKIACNLWHGDAVRAANADWQKLQAENWEKAYNDATSMLAKLRRRFSFWR
jgi:SAM-dependent methyltransferase